MSPKARVSVVSANTQWTITDDFRHEDSSFTIKYDVYESVEFNSNNRQIAVLRAGASIVNKPSGRETIAIQLFLSQGENDVFRGKRLQLAAYADGPTPQPPEDKARFDAVLALLKRGAFADGPAAAAFQLSRVARERALGEDEIRRLVSAHTEGRQFGLLGEPVVNVLL
ncbi:MAG: potassium-transporting ATPase subunit C, partial [Luteitalea sp.]|nr:potassium-transporting ATPase subunit C [Luteitalea sp.]